VTPDETTTTTLQYVDEFAERSQRFAKAVKATEES
jgi:hypothetical protein